MSTENVEVFNRYRGNGAATQFSIGFPYLKREYVKVYLFKGATGEEVKLSNNRFSFVNDSTIKFPVLDTDEILQEGDILTIQRETTLGSEFEFDNQRRLFPVEVMNADDLGFQQIQELRREINRSVRVNPTAEETPEELLSTVYDKLDSATAVATDAILAAEQATIAAEKATTAVEAVEKQIEETQEYVDGAKLDIDSTVEAAKQEINTTIDEAQMNLSDTIEQAVEDVKQEAIKAADETIQATIGGSVDEAADYARESKAWARGEDADVEEFAPGENEHSSRGYADLAMAIANTPEDVPVDASTLLALDVIRGPKGDSGEADFSGDINFTGTFKVNSDSNHPVSIYGMAGASATGYQIEDTLGAGDSDFEHYATGDRYGTRITNHNNTSNTSVSVDLYQSNAGRSVLDATDVETVLVPTPAADDDSQKAVNSEWVNNIVDAKTLRTSQITNCITEIPQDIKLELSADKKTVVLKTGSKLYHGDGTVVNIASDKTLTWNHNGSDIFLIAYSDGYLNVALGSETVSTPPSQQTASDYYIRYCTSNNTLYYQDSAALRTNLCFPLAKIDVVDGQFIIKQVFNGFGYIGSTAFVLPSVKGLIPNGRNADGSLKNIESTLTRVHTHWINPAWGNQHFNLLLWESDIEVTSASRVSKNREVHQQITYSYVEDENMWYYTGDSGATWSKIFLNIGGTLDFIDGKITSFNPRLPFQAVDRSDSSWVAQQAMPSGKYIDLTLGASGASYTAPANGWVRVAKVADGSGQYVSLYSNSGYGLKVVPENSKSPANGTMPVKKGETFKVTYNLSGATQVFRFIYAEGEN